MITENKYYKRFRKFWGDWYIVVLVATCFVFLLLLVRNCNEFNVVFQTGSVVLTSIFVGVFTRNFSKNQERIRKEHDYKQEIIAGKATAITHLASEQPIIVAAAISELIELIQNCNDLKKEIPDQAKEIYRNMQGLVDLAFKTNFKRVVQQSPSVVSAKANGLIQISEKDVANKDHGITNTFAFVMPEELNFHVDPYLNFESADLQNIILNSASLKGIRMLNGNLRNSRLVDIKLSQAQLTNVDFTGAEITSVNFDNAFMGRVILNDAEICDSSMKGSWLDGAEANNNTLLTSCNLTDAKLANTNFIGSDLRTSNFTGANFENANLMDARMDRVNLVKAYMHKTGFNNTSLIDADMMNTDLREADLTNAHLKGANLTGANLTGANLTGANLTGANLTGANLTDANLAGADLLGVDLTEANLTGMRAEDEELKSALLKKGSVKNLV